MKKKKRLGELTMQDFNGYFVGGIEFDSIKRVMNAKDYKRFVKFMRGQTCGLVGNVPLVYGGDLERFLKRLPVID